MDGQALDRFFGHVGFGDERDAETQFGGLFQTLLPTRRRAHLARQADLAERQKSAWQGFATQAALDGEHHGQVGGGLADAHPTHRVDKHVLVHAGHTRMAMQHRQQHGQAVAVQTHTQTAWAGAAAVDQGLDFHQQRPRPLKGHHDAAARHGLGVLAQENRARVAHALQAFFGHRKHANLVDRAKTVFDGPHQSVAGMGVALEIQHGVDHVLEHAGTRERAFFGDVTHQHHGGAAGLGQAGQVCCTLAHLRHRPGRTGELVGVDSLDRVDHRHLR